MKRVFIGLSIILFAVTVYAANTRTWNASYELLPADGDNISAGATRIRNLKTDIRERMAHDHYMAVAGTDADHGEHKQSTYRTGDYTCAGTANKGTVYTKDVSAKAELFYCDEDGDEVQMTTGGAVYPFPSGTTMPFYQASCPTGWTEAAIQANSGARIVAAGGTGGTSGGITNFQALTHTHTGTMAATAVSAAAAGTGSSIAASYQHAHSFTIVSATIVPKYMDFIVCTLD